jgi:hypothetical protein
MMKFALPLLSIIFDVLASVKTFCFLPICLLETYNIAYKTIIQQTFIAMISLQSFIQNTISQANSLLTNNKQWQETCLNVETQFVKSLHSSCTVSTFIMYSIYIHPLASDQLHPCTKFNFTCMLYFALIPYYYDVTSFISITPIDIMLHPPIE